MKQIYKNRNEREYLMGFMVLCLWVFIFGEMVGGMRMSINLTCFFVGKIILGFICVSQRNLQAIVNYSLNYEQKAYYTLHKLLNSTSICAVQN